MKKTTKTTKAPAPAIKSTVAPQVVKTASATPSILAKPKGAKVTLTAHIDIGFGNTLFIRGDGAGLSWSKGKPLHCAECNAWTLVLPGVENAFSFKFLVNDETWSADPNYIAGPGDTVTVTPVF